MGFGRDFFGAATAALPQGVKLGIQGIEYAREKEKDARAAQTATQAAEQKTLSTVFEIMKGNDPLENGQKIQTIMNTLPEGDFKDGIGTFISFNQKETKELLGWREEMTIAINDPDNQKIVAGGGKNFVALGAKDKLKDIYRAKGKLKKLAIASRLYRITKQAGGDDPELQGILLDEVESSKALAFKGKADRERALIKKTQQKITALEDAGETTQGMEGELSIQLSNLAMTLKASGTPADQINQEINFARTGDPKGQTELERKADVLGVSAGGDDIEILGGLMEKKKQPRPVKIMEKIKQKIANGKPLTQGETQLFNVEVNKGKSQLSLDSDGNLIFTTGGSNVTPTNLTKSQAQLDVIENTRSLISDYREQLKSSTQVGGIGSLRRFLQGAGEQLDAFRDFIARDVDLGKAEDAVTVLFDPSLPKLEFLANEMAYSLARSREPNARLSVQDVKSARDSLQMDKVLTGKKSVEAVLEAFEKRLDQKAGTARRRIYGKDAAAKRFKELNNGERTQAEIFGIMSREGY